MKIEIDVTGPEEIVANDPEFKEVIAKFQEAIRLGILTTDHANGYGKHIRVDVYVDDWMRPIIERIYTAAGWRVSWKFYDRVMLLI